VKNCKICAENKKDEDIVLTFKNSNHENLNICFECFEFIYLINLDKQNILNEKNVENIKSIENFQNIDKVDNLKSPKNKISNLLKLKKSNIDDNLNVTKPLEIINLLDKKIVNQHEAKKILTMNIYNHYNKIILKKENLDLSFTKSNMILFGESGSGKTLILKEIAKIINKPIVIIDITTLTESGYVGLDVSTIFQDLYIAADRSIERMEEGIIVFDEIDKLGSRLNKNGTNPIQQELLTILEGRKVQFQENAVNMNNNEEILEIDTTNILFIGIGAFTSLFQNKEKETSFGFGEHKLISKTITQDDFVKYGLMKEFVSRFSVFQKLNSLDKNDLLEILHLDNSILNEYKKLFSIENVNLIFDKSYLNYVVETSFQEKKGARGLKYIIDKDMLNIHFKYINNIHDITLNISYKNGIILKEIKEKNKLSTN